jgi:hypothetical protein
MNLQFLSKMKRCVPAILFAFVVCGVVGLNCPMPASATDAHHSQQPSHHSSSSQTTGECPDQLTTSAGIFETDDASVGFVSAAPVSWLTDIPSFGLFKFLGNERTPHSTTYPLLYLLFSVFLN